MKTKFRVALNIGAWRTVRGERIILPILGEDTAVFSSSFFITKIEERKWKVYHLSTGCGVAFGSSRKRAIAKARSILREKGIRAFRAAVKAQRKWLKEEGMI